MSSLLTLHLRCTLNIKAVLEIHQMLDQDIGLTKRFCVIYDEEGEKDDYLKVIS
jgi:hypothetical protein